MNIDNFHNTLATFLEIRPFHPFVIALTNGDKFEVDHPTSLSFRDGPAVFHKPGGQFVVFDHEGVNQITTGLMERADPKSH